MFKVPSGASAAGPAYQSSGAASASHVGSDQPQLSQAMQARWIAEHADRLFGAEKRDTVERLLAAICSAEAQAGREDHSLCLESFLYLAGLGKPRHAGQFTVAMCTTVSHMVDGSRKEVLEYRLEIEDTVLANRSFASARRDSMLDFIRRIEHLGIALPDDMQSSYCFQDAELINRLAKALPDEIGLQARVPLDILAIEIDEVNAVPEYTSQPHVAMAVKAMLLADYFPDQRFNIHFRRELGLDNNDYFISVRPKINQCNPNAIAHAPVEVYSGAVSPGEEKQTLSMLILAIRLRVSNELKVHRATIDSSAALIARRRDAMTQDPATRWFLTERGDDPSFHYGNYRYLGEDAKAQTFSAAFGDVVMVFSNVAPMMGELQGEHLQKCLQHGRYRNLNELMATGHRTASDPILRAVMWPLHDDVLPMMLGLDEDGLRILGKEIDWLQVADTTLGALWDSIHPAAAPVIACAAHEPLHAGWRSSLRRDVFSAPLYGFPSVAEATWENPAPEGVSWRVSMAPAAPRFEVDGSARPC